METIAGEWKGERVFTLCVVLDAGWKLRRDDIGDGVGVSISPKVR